MLGAFGDETPPPSVVLSIDAGRAIERILRGTTNPLMVVLKPFPELLQPQFPRDLLRKTKLVLYGSFNLRNTIVETEDAGTDDDGTKGGAAKDGGAKGGGTKGTKNVYEFLNTSFKDVVLYESYLAAGEKNSLEKTTFPAFFEKASKIAASANKRFRFFWQGFFTSVDAWNENLLKEQLEKVQRKAAAVSSAFANPAATKEERLTAVAEVQRNMKIIENITVADSVQVVIADIGVGAILLAEPGEFLKPDNIQKSLLKKGTKGTVAVPNEAYGTVKVIVGIKLEEMMRDVVAFLV